MSSLGHLPLDRHSADGRRLLAALAAGYGEPIAAAALLPEDLFLLRSGWAPGLRFVGGRMRAGPDPQGRPPVVFNVAGGGETLEAALVACVGEAVERAGQVERAGDVTLCAAVDGLAGRIALECEGRLRAMLARTDWRSLSLDWVAATDLATGEARLLPADWCLRRAVAGSAHDAGAALSVGAAAGASFEDAAARALLELVERDAVSLWWRSPTPRPAPMEAVVRAAGRLLADLRSDAAAARMTWLLDLTGDLAIPVVAALAADPDGRGLACGFAARPTAAAAASAAIVELCQQEVGLLLARARREQQGEASLGDGDRRHLLRAEAIDVRAHPALRPAGLATTSPGLPEAGSPLAALRAAFAAHGTEAALVDLTRPEAGLAVVKAVAPALQLAPDAVPTARLERSLAARAEHVAWPAGVAPL